MRISKIGEQWAHGGGAWLNRHSNVRTGMIIASIIFITSPSGHQTAWSLVWQRLSV